MRKIMICLGIAVAILAGPTVTAQAQSKVSAGRIPNTPFSDSSGNLDDIGMDMTWTGDGPD